MLRAPAGLPRWVEVPVALAGLVVSSPLLALGAILVRLSSPGPIIFRQQRVGRGGRLFTLYKFRTMDTGPEGARVTAGGDPRVTPMGKLLRWAKLDELPELWNVLCGDMSFVGPRPEVPMLVDAREPLWQRVLQVRPGITDPVTLSLRNEEQLLAEAGGDTENFYANVLQPYKLRRYVEYLETQTPLKDLLVIVKTVAVVAFPGLAPQPSLETIRDQSTTGQEWEDNATNTDTSEETVDFPDAGDD